MSDKALIYGLIGGAIANYLTRPKQQQLQQQLLKMPHEFDYVIDMYTDKIEITDRSGSKTTLSSIDELNNWLSSVTGKNILIWNNGDMEGTLKLTNNTYVVNGKPTKFETILTQSDIDLYYLTPCDKVQDKETGEVIYAIKNTIYNEEERGEICIPIRNINIFAIGATINIWCDIYRTEEICENIRLTAINSPFIMVAGITGGVIASGNYIRIDNSNLVDGLFVESGRLYLFNSVIENYLVIESRHVSMSGNTYQVPSPPYIDIQGLSFLNVMPNSSLTAGLPFDVDFGSNFTFEITSVYERIYMTDYSLLIPVNINEIDIQINKEQKTITVTNKTDRPLNLVINIRYRILF